jgi:hypothetical protein
MTRLILEVPQQLENGKFNQANEHLLNRQEVGREFECLPLGTLETWLVSRQINNPDWLSYLDNTYHLLEAPDDDLVRTAARILNFHNDERGTGFAPNRGFVRRVEVDRLLFPSTPVDLGSNFKLSGKHADYRDNMLHANKAWKDSKGAGITIAIIDSGIESGSLISVGKYKDLIDPAGSSSHTDQSGHGTAMATIIKNVARDANVDVLRVYERTHLKLWDLMVGISTAVTDCQAQIINLSLGFPELKDCTSCGASWQPRSKVLETLIEGLTQLHTKVSGPPEPIFVCAVGNNRKVDGIHHPAAYDLTLAVGAVNSSYNRSAFSNYDQFNKKDRYLLLPGGDDTQDVNGDPVEYVGEAQDSSHNTNYCVGTSPAAAYASALLALYWASPTYIKKTPNELLDEMLRLKCSKGAIPNHDSYQHGAGFFSWQ